MINLSDHDECDDLRRWTTDLDDAASLQVTQVWVAPKLAVYVATVVLHCCPARRVFTGVGVTRREAADGGKAWWARDGRRQYKCHVGLHQLFKENET